MDVRFRDAASSTVMLSAVLLDREFGRACAVRVRTRMSALYAVDTAVELFPLPGRWRPLPGPVDRHLVADLDPDRELVVAAVAGAGEPAVDDLDWNATTEVTVIGVFERDSFGRGADDE